MKLLLNPEYSLYEKDGRPFCDSLQIAETFEKRHDNVLADIRATIAEVDCNFNLLNFEEIKYKDSKGRSYPKYLLSKDGFTLLVMGYTGKKRFILARDEYHKALRELDCAIAEVNLKATGNEPDIGN